jgi:hypothetical protein
MREHESPPAELIKDCAGLAEHKFILLASPASHYDGRSRLKRRP